jgi:hypothetical protein
MSSRHRGPARDLSDSAFSAILGRLCECTGALAAALVDAEGETVDYAGFLDPYEIKVVAAEWRIVLAVVQESKLPGFRHVTSLCVRARNRSYAIESMPDGYAVALRLPRRGFAVSRRALSEALRDLAREAGITLPEHRSQVNWAHVRVRTAATSRRRPEAIWLGEKWSQITVLGRYQARDLSRSELGFLARLASGAEVFLVREPLGRWFIDNASAMTVEEPR